MVYLDGYSWLFCLVWSFYIDSVVGATGQKKERRRNQIMAGGKDVEMKLEDDFFREWPSIVEREAFNVVESRSSVLEDGGREKGGRKSTQDG